MFNSNYAVTVFKIEGTSYSIINARTDRLGYIGIAAVVSNDPDVSRVYLIDRDDNRICRLYKGGERVA